MTYRDKYSRALGQLSFEQWMTEVDNEVLGNGLDCLSMTCPTAVWPIWFEDGMSGSTGACNAVHEDMTS